MKFQSDTLTYQERLKPQFIFPFLVLTAIILYGTYDKPVPFELIVISILMTGLGLFLLIHLKAAIYFNEIELSGNDLILRGFEVNKPIYVQVPIDQTNIKLKVEASRHQSMHQYYLIFEHNSKKYRVNRLFNWNYEDVMELFNEFKMLKGEKIILDEKDILKRIQKKIEDSQN